MTALPATVNAALLRLQERWEPAVTRQLADTLTRWAAANNADISGVCAGGSTSLVVRANVAGGDHGIIIKLSPLAPATTRAEAEFLAATTPDTLVDVDADNGLLVMRRIPGTSPYHVTEPDITNDVTFVIDTITATRNLPTSPDLPSVTDEIRVVCERARRVASGANDHDVVAGLADIITHLDDLDGDEWVALDLHPKNVLDNDGAWTILDPRPAVGQPEAAAAKWSIVRRGPGEPAGADTATFVDAFAAAGIDRSQFARWLRPLAAWELGSQVTGQRREEVRTGPLRPYLARTR